MAAWAWRENKKDTGDVELLGAAQLGYFSRVDPVAALETVDAPLAPSSHTVDDSILVLAVLSTSTDRRLANLDERLQMDTVLEIRGDLHCPAL